jgi:hypothetical protein
VNELTAALAAWATFAGLSTWSAAASTRALGEPQHPRKNALALIALLLAAQLGCAIAVVGPAGGLAIVACAWMVLGWPFGMALSAWPARSLLWSRRSGWAALGGAVLLAVGRFSL